MVEVEADVREIVLVDDSGVLRDDRVVEEEIAAVAVYVSDKDFGGVLPQPLHDTVAHSARGTVGEGEAHHVFESDTVLFGPHHALGEYVSLSTARRGKNEESPVVGVDGLELVFVVGFFHKELIFIVMI